MKVLMIVTESTVTLFIVNRDTLKLKAVRVLPQPYPSGLRHPEILSTTPLQASRNFRIT
jgi:hypothetical protein